MVMIHDKSKSAGRRRQGHGGKLQILADELPVSVRKILFYTRESIVFVGISIARNQVLLLRHPGWCNRHRNWRWH